MNRYNLRHRILKTLLDHYNQYISKTDPKDFIDIHAGLTSSAIAEKLGYKNVYPQLVILLDEKHIHRKSDYIFKISLDEPKPIDNIEQFRDEWYFITESGKAAYHKETHLQDRNKQWQSTASLVLSVLAALFTILSYFYNPKTENQIDRINERLDSIVTNPVNFQLTNSKMGDVQVKMNGNKVDSIKFHERDSSAMSK